MSRLARLLIATTLLHAGCAAAADTPAVRVILVGDSTMASKSGYGDALCARFTAQVDCRNLARGGRSSKSFRAEGRWDEVRTLLAEAKANGGAPRTYVLVQFGHNDQPGKGVRATDLVTEFPANMARYARETAELGGVPVLVTPLTRRGFKGGYLKDDLMPWAEATRRTAAAGKVPLIDLNRLSAEAVQAMGQDEANTLAVEPPPAGALPAPAAFLSGASEPQGRPKSAFDYTHLGAKGADLFSGMVARELVRVEPSLRAYLK